MKRASGAFQADQGPHRKFAGPGRAGAGAAKRQVPRAGSKTIERELSVLRAAIYQFRDCHPAAPAPEIWRLPPTAPRNRWLSAEEARRLVAAAGTDHLRLFILLMLATGARPGAILELRWSQVDLAGGLVHLDPPGRPETGKGRARVPLADGTLRAALGQARQLAETDHVIEYAGAPIRCVKTGFRTALRRAGLQPGDVTPNTLRHTAATWMAQRGTPLWEIAQVLGHESTRMVERHYAHHHPDHLRRAREALDAAMDGIGVVPGRDYATDMRQGAEQAAPPAP